MANNTTTDDNECEDTLIDSKEVVITKQFGNPLYECYEGYENDYTNGYANIERVVDSGVNILDAVPTVQTVSRPKPRERTTLRRNKKNSSELVYSNVSELSGEDSRSESLITQTMDSNEPNSKDLPNLIIELESMLNKMSSDSFYATPISVKRQESVPTAKPRRSLSTTSSTSTSSSSLSYRPLPQPPKVIPPPKPPHLPPDIPPPPLPDLYPAPEVPPRFPLNEQSDKNDSDSFDDLSIRSQRKLSEPSVMAPKIPIVDPYYCQHYNCKVKGIARSQTFRTSDRHCHRLKPTVINRNIENGIHQKCGYLWKTGSKRVQFLDRWCVLHKNDLNIDNAVLGYYMDRKTTSARGKIMIKDIAFVKILDTIGTKTKLPNNSSIDITNFCYFEVGVNTRKGRVYLFAAKCLSDHRLWINAISQAIAWDKFTLKDVYHCGYVHMKNGISGQWVTNFVVLSGKQMTVISKEFEPQSDDKSIASEDSDSLRSDFDYKIYDLRKVMSISYASAHVINSCAAVQEMGQPICVTFTNQVLYLQAEYKSHTELWHQSLTTLWSVPVNGTLEDQYLTTDNIPVAIDKCINFVSTYGTDIPNIYLQQNLQSPIANTIVDAFRANAWEVQMKIGVHSVHDITTALVLFLKSMSECILTEKLYHNWIKANEQENRNERLQKFKILLHLLPIVNYLTLKKLIAHLVCIIENSDKNKTCILNIAPAVCHSLLFIKCCDKIVDDRVSTFDGDSTGIDIMTDFILSYGWLFDVTAEELEKERKIQKALELLKDAKQKELSLSMKKKSASDCEEFLIAVYIYSKEWGKCLNVRLTPTMTAQHLIEYCVKKAHLKESIERLSVYEVVYDSQLERCLHYSDIVLGVTLSWLKWSQHYSHNNYLCIKQNQLYRQILPQIEDQTPITIFSELKFADKTSKGFKKVLVEFIGAKLSLYKDEKGEKCLGQWNIEDIHWYLGADKKRSNNANNNKLSITFIERNEPVVKSKESPYFGRTICSNGEEEYHKWIAAMLCAEYPNGFLISSQRQRLTDLLA